MANQWSALTELRT